MEKPIEGLPLKFNVIGDGHRYNSEMYKVVMQCEYKLFEGTIDVLRLDDGDDRDGLTCSLCRTMSREYFDNAVQLYAYLQKHYSKAEIDSMEYWVDEDPNSYPDPEYCNEY